MIRNLFKSDLPATAKPAKAPDVRELYNAGYFDGRVLIENPIGEHGVLLNIMVQGEVARLDVNERLDALIEIQKELLATQQAILAALQKPDRA